MTPLAAALFWLSVVPARTNAQVVLTIDRKVRVHARPALKSARVDGLAAGDTVTLVPGARRRSFFKVRFKDSKTGWVHGRYLLLPDLEERAFGFEAVAAPTLRAAAAFPTCGPEAHYRWKQKITTSGFRQSPGQSSINAALNWAPLSFFGHSLLSWCADRVGRETKAFSIVGWVRRMRKEDDGDIHVEITQTAAAAEENCFIVEIPAAELSPRFNTARNNLLSLLGMTRVADRDFASPTRVKFTGLAFWDGWHATSNLPVRHGRCNSTKGAAWELHPVFQVTAP